MAGNKDSVPKDYQWEMAYGLSNGHVTDNNNNTQTISNAT